MNQQIISPQIVRNYHPCYDPTRWVSSYWSGLPSELLKRQDIPIQDRLWVASHVDFIERQVLLDFAIWCIDQVFAAVTPDEDSEILRDTLAHYATGETNAMVLSVTTGNLRDVANRANNSLLLYVCGIAQSALGETDLENAYRTTLDYIGSAVSAETRIELSNGMVEYLIDILEN